MVCIARVAPFIVGLLALAWPASGRADEQKTLTPGPFERVAEVEGGVPRDVSPFDPEGRAFVTVTAGAAWVWDAATLKPLAGPLPHEHLWVATLASGGRTLFTSGPKEVRVWDVATSKLLSATQVARGTTNHFGPSPDGTRFATIDGADRKRVAVWRTGQDKPDLFLPHGDSVGTADFDHGGKRIVTHSLFTGFHVWSAETGRELYPPIQSFVGPMNPGQAHFNVDDTRLLVAGQRGFVIVDAGTGRRVVDVRFDGVLQTGHLGYGGDGLHVAVAMLNWNDRGAVRVFEAATGRLVREFGTDMYTCHIGPDERRAWCGTLGRKAADMHEVWDLKTGKLVQTIAKAGDAAMSPDGTTVLVPNSHRYDVPVKTAVWRLKKGEAGNGR